ncbi:MAG: SLC13 family permease [candidate division WOR-3 bacterium]|nr:SLC13 family permease [candidate division WOR-3 bacterium]
MEKNNFEKIFRPEFIFLDLEFNNKEELFSFVKEFLEKKKVIEEEEAKKLVGLLKERESLGSTGVGLGIALPHLSLKTIKETVCLIFRLKKAIDWQALDQKPVNLVVFIFSQEREHDFYLQTLSYVAQILHDKKIVSQILKPKRREEVYEYLVYKRKISFFKKYQKVFYYLLGMILIFFFAKFLFAKIKLPYDSPFNSPFWIKKEVIAILLFFSMVLGTLFFFSQRVAFGGFALTLLLLTGVVDIETTIKFMSIPTILFIIAVMIMVKWFSEKGVFRYLVLKAIQYFGNSPLILFGSLMFFSALLGGLIDEVSAILITFGIAIQIVRYTKGNIIPYLIGLVMATNIGSALTLIGNPIGIYLAFSAQLTFLDFLRNSTPISLLSLFFTIFLILLIYKKNLKLENKIELKKLEEEIDKKEVKIAVLVFLVFVILVVFHSFIERLLKIEERSMLLGAGLLIVGFIVFYEKEHSRFFVERGPDWWTILYFMFLFANAGCLEYTGVTYKLAYLLSEGAKRFPFFREDLKETFGSLTMLLWGSGILSGFVDNLPIVAALVPVVKNLILKGIPLANQLYWSLLIGGCFGGNLTMIGSTANLVAIGVYERAFRKSFRFSDWLKAGIIVTFFTLFFANFLFLVKILTLK